MVKGREKGEGRGEKSGKTRDPRPGTRDRMNREHGRAKGGDLSEMIVYG
jgi:hypothetical protein